MISEAGRRSVRDFPAKSSREPAGKPVGIHHGGQKMNSIRMNQMGLAEKLPKSAVVTSEEPLVLSDGEGSEIRRFDQIRTYFDAASGDRTAKILLPDLPCGTYRLRQGESNIGFSVKPATERRWIPTITSGAASCRLWETAWC